jgi:hypothetical protein
MILQQAGATVTGAYLYDPYKPSSAADADAYHLKGTASGSFSLVGTWDEGGLDTGTFEFTMDKDGMGFTGIGQTAEDKKAGFYDLWHGSRESEIPPSGPTENGALYVEIRCDFKPVGASGWESEDSIKPGDYVYVSVNVKSATASGDAPFNDATVTITAAPSLGFSSITANLDSETDGYYAASFTIPADAPPDSYTVTATASATGYETTSNTYSFTLRSPQGEQGSGGQGAQPNPNPDVNPQPNNRGMIDAGNAVVGGLIGAAIGGVVAGLTSLMGGGVYRGWTKTPESESMQQEKQKQTRNCNELLAEWNSVCSWFGTQSQNFWQQKVKADNDIAKIKADAERALQILHNCRGDLLLGKDIGYLATGAGVVGTFVAFWEAELPVLIFGAQAARAVWRVRTTADGTRYAEDNAQIAQLDNWIQQVKQGRRKQLDEAIGRIKALQAEYLKNRSRLDEIEQLMIDQGCEKIRGIPSKCSHVDSAAWKWMENPFLPHDS